MSLTDAKPARRRFKWVQALVGFLLLGAVVGLAVYLNSDSFRERVRIRVAAESYFCVPADPGAVSNRPR